MRAPDIDRTPLPPVNTEAEQALLGAIFVNNSAYGRVSDFLLPEHFGNAAHARIFAAISTLIERGGVADPVILKNHFDQDGALNDIGGAQYLARLAEAAVTIINAEFYGRAIHDLYLRRELITVGQDVVADAFRADLDDPGAEQIERGIEKLFTLADQGRDPDGRKRVVAIGEAAERSLESTQRAYATDAKIVGVSTGIRALDRIIGGLAGGDFDIIAGRPGQGKSALMMSIGWAAALAGKPVHIFSGDMTAEELARRMLAALSGVSAGRQRRGSIEQADWPELMSARETLSQYPILVDDRPLLLPRIRQQIRAMKRRHKTALVMIDHIQLVKLRLDDDTDGRVFEVGRVSNTLKREAVDNNLAIVGLSQLSRKVEERDDKRPNMADLRNAGELEQDSDVVMMLYREETYLEKAEPTQRERESLPDFDARWSRWKNALEISRGRAEIICPKVRHDKIDTAHVNFDGGRSLFFDRELNTGGFL